MRVITVSASIFHQESWVIAQCLAPDVASQGATAEEAVTNLREALELHFTPPTAESASAPQCREVSQTVTLQVEFCD